MFVYCSHKTTVANYSHRVVKYDEVLRFVKHLPHRNIPQMNFVDINWTNFSARLPVPNSIEILRVVLEMNLAEGQMSRRTGGFVLRIICSFCTLSAKVS
jgi:hypothetical protein